MKQQKMASLLPSLKEKRRYLVFELIAAETIPFKEFKESLFKEIHSFLGRLGQAQAGIELLDDWKENKGILKVSSRYLDHLKAVFVLIRKINKTDALVTSIGVSGTLNKARNKFMIH